MCSVGLTSTNSDRLPSRRVRRTMASEDTVESLIEELPKEIIEGFTLSCQYINGGWYAGYDDYEGLPFTYSEEIRSNMTSVCVVYEFGGTLMQALTKLKDGLIRRGFMG